MKIDFRCNCPTSDAAQKYIAGEIDVDALRRAIRHHVNHACPDFMAAYELLAGDTKGER